MNASNRLVRHRLVPWALIAAVVVSGCATKSDTAKAQSTGIGVALGCAGGAAVAALLKQDAAKGCVIGAVAGGIAGYQKARFDEIKRAREAAAAMPVTEGGTPAVVQTQSVEVTEADTGKVQTVETFKALSMDVPVSQLQTKEGQEVMRKLGDYARKVADERADSVNLDIAKTASGSRSSAPNRVVLESASERVGKGLLVKRRLADTAVPERVQRVTVEASNPERVTL